jgi:hypothetical protein
MKTAAIHRTLPIPLLWQAFWPRGSLEPPAQGKPPRGRVLPPQSIKSRGRDEAVAAFDTHSFARLVRLNGNGKDSVDARIVF